MTEEKSLDGVAVDEVVESNGQEIKAKEESSLSESELEAAIITQVEYYFGDLNLPRDRFLREQIKLDEGWVPLDVMIKFNRLAKMTTDTDIIAKAINSSTSGLLEVSEDNKKVRRNPEMPIPELSEERRKDLSDRTVYVKGFPKGNTTLDDLLKFFKQFEEAENVIMRRYIDKRSKKRLFKGSIFVTFKTKEQAEKFMDSKDLKYEDMELLTHWQTDYLKMKEEEYAARKEEKVKKNKPKEEIKSEKPDFRLPAGTVLRFSDCDEKIMRENIKDALVALGAEVAYVDFKVGDTEGWVRLAKINTAKDIAEKITDGKLKILDKDISFNLVEGDEEKAYLEKSAMEMMNRRKNIKSHQKQNKGRNFKGKQGRKRKGDQSEDGPPSKVKSESKSEVKVDS